MNPNTDKYFGISNRIAKWKEVTEFEAVLSDSAVKDMASRRLYSEYYKQINPEYYNKGRELALQMYESHKADFHDTDFNEVYTDMVYCLHRYGLSFQDYCIYNLINKSERCRSEFVADKLRYHYCDILNSPDVYHLMTDKYQCYSRYKKYYKRNICPLLKPEDFSAAILFISKHRSVIFKPLQEHSGHGIKIVTHDYEGLDDFISATIANNPGILEELIVQGDEMNLLNPRAVNTCRILTFTTGQDVTIIGATVRMGVGNAITDNAGSGGIYASIDVESGIIKTDAKNYNNVHYLFHPTTGTKIPGFQMPHWDEAKGLIRNLALEHPGTTLISWDIAYSNRGWCMVEANDNGTWGIIQSNSEVGLKNMLYSLMDKHFKSI